jgi:hypothetical protein
VCLPASFRRRNGHHGSELPVLAFSRHLKHRRRAGRSIGRQARINRVHRSLSLTILGPERKLFVFAVCLGAATKNGHRFLTDTQSAGKGQVLYYGFTRPREATKPISTGSIKRPQRRSRGREAEISASFSAMR